MKKETVLLSKRDKTRQMTILAMFVAIIVVMGMVPFLGFIPILGLSFQIITIPVIIGAVILGRKAGVILATVFGVVSLIRGAMSGGFDFLFVLPWISILPRVIFGLIIYDVFKFFKKLLPGKRILALALGFLTVSLIHTLLVVPMIATGFPIVFESPSVYDGILKGEYGEATIDSIGGVQTFNAIMKWMFGVLITNGIGEAILAMLIGSVITDRLIAFLTNNNQAILQGGVYEDSH
ncbi:MAG TPA: ECF transporter S component [Candidatus Izemoplasmatales bacterium]|nr:ECF transporter S component [Candidatus Izemoplasmatales bacterium]